MYLERAVGVLRVSLPQGKGWKGGNLSLYPNLIIPCRELDVCSLLLGNKEGRCLAHFAEAKMTVNAE